jgi:hypothetical protein
VYQLRRRVSFSEGLYAGVVVKCAKGDEMEMAAMKSQGMMVLLI